ncbi:MAG: Rieske 2Fe-2S domain-containing protein [Acidimicrobiaceae bacterium]|nr:Rieske 2Fe-2S domain-containing protein [Acidimicrobiaceae bacterium]MXY11041.1 Rieske 2Fe-2S domain-containing protein [Acidimicrobiaceae bacterium]MXZ64637.1 Rieske 2Fe-2S domain-containing protein [Acidimicrobiaceae bacterium]MYF34632.1 Rieske 2Fe-2S domain-containing protein [Acidimicrobiaceae bacterium]MYG79570.1 Rieske 2Fe-2S domain-containing protein [Acidimicrobiaceae bacterium]
MTAIDSGTVPPDFDYLVQPHRVHRRIYTDPQIFDLEMTRVFAASWCYVGHESEIPAPGDYRTTTLGLRPVLMTRGRDGAVNVLLNRCTHRGTVLAGESSGCAKRFVCPYHGWTFAPDGQLVAIPFPADHAVEDRSTLSLGRLTTATYRGFVFATLNAEPEPLDCWLGEAREAFDTIVDRHPGGDIAVMGSPHLLEFLGNWKLSWDNAADGLHATFAHESYNTLGEMVDTETVLARDPGSTPMVSKALRNGHMVVDQRPGIPQGPWATMRRVPFREPLESALVDAGEESLLDLATGSMINLSLFPNLLFVGNQLLVIEPVAVDRTRLQLWLTSAPGAPSEIDLLRLRVDEDFVNFGTPDDLDMFERVQRGLSIPEMEWIDMSRGLPDSDAADGDATIYGPITSEAPQRRYLAHYAKLMTTPAATRAL